MINVTVNSTGIPQLIAKIEKIKRGDLPHLKNGVRMAAEHIADIWRSVVAQSTSVEYDGKNFTVTRRTGTYEQSIRVIYPYENELSALIKAEAPYANAIETGTPPHDMKPGLLKGRKFVRIPFRHATPTGMNKGKGGQMSPTGMRVMSEDIYQIIKKAQQVGKSNIGIRSKVITTAERKVTYTWKAGQYSGMKQVGRALHHQYITFRTVSVNSDPSSWWHPGTPPRPLSRAVAEMTKEAVSEILNTALQADIGDERR